MGDQRLGLRTASASYNSSRSTLTVGSRSNGPPRPFPREISLVAVSLRRGPDLPGASSTSRWRASRTRAPRGREALPPPSAHRHAVSPPPPLTYPGASPRNAAFSSIPCSAQNPVFPLQFTHFSSRWLRRGKLGCVFLSGEVPADLSLGSVTFHRFHFCLRKAFSYLVAPGSLWSSQLLQDTLP